MNAITGNRKANTDLWTASFSFLLFGQVIDNITRVKNLFIILEFLLAFWFFVMGYTSI
jgi:hypothetical protein